MEATRYKPIAEVKGKLRLYLNDPRIQTLLPKTTPHELKFPIPIEIEGKMVVAQTEDGEFHWFFVHENPDFIPVFVDLESKRLEEVGVKESVTKNGKK